MRNGIALALLLALASLALLSWWLASATDERPQRADADATAPRSRTSEPGSAQPPQPPRPPATARSSGIDGAFLADSLAAGVIELAPEDEHDDRSGVLRGRLRVRQKPWIHPAGVELRLTRSWLDSVVPTNTEGEEVAPRRDELKATTDEQGRFAFRVVPPDCELFFLIGHRTEWEDYQKVARLPHAGEEIDLGDVWLDERGELTGRVVQHGMPVAGATVRAVDDPLLAGTSGFTDVSAARLEHAELFRATGTLGTGPMPEWVARRDRFLPFPSVVTGPSGEFRLRGVRPGTHDLLVVLERGPAAAYGRSNDVLVASGQTTEVGSIALVEPRTVGAYFVDDQHQPWVGAEVAVVHAASGFGSRTVRTDAHGYATLAALPGVPGSLLFQRPGGGTWHSLAWRLSPRTNLPEDHARYVVPRGPELRVFVGDEQGRALPGGKVRAFVVGQAFRAVDRALPPRLQPVETEPGTHVGVLPCPVVVVASVPGHAPALAHADANAPIVDLVLLPLQRATVRVHDVLGRAIAGAEVRVQVHADPDLQFPGSKWDALANDRVRLGTTDDDGELEIPVWPAYFSFQVRHRDFAPTANPQQKIDGGQRVDLLLVGAAAIVGRLTFEGRTAPAGLRVLAVQQPAPGHDGREHGFLERRAAITGDDGTFAFRRLAAGIWELQPELPAVPTARGERRTPAGWKTQRVQLAEGQELHTTIELQADVLAPCQLEGAVTQNGATVPGALVRVRELEPQSQPARERNAMRRRFGAQALDLLGPPETAPWRRCETDAFGEYRFRGLVPNAKYELRVDLPSGGRLQHVDRRVVVAGGGQRAARADVALHTSDVRLTCTFEGPRLARRMVRLRRVEEGDVETGRFDVLLDANGEVWIDALPAGTWRAEPTHGGRCEPDTFTIAPATAALVSLQVRAR